VRIALEAEAPVTFVSLINGFHPTRSDFARLPYIVHRRCVAGEESFRIYEQISGIEAGTSLQSAGRVLRVGLPEPNLALRFRIADYVYMDRHVF
jgi:hypothetical protein